MKKNLLVVGGAGLLLTLGTIGGANASGLIHSKDLATGSVNHRVIKNGTIKRSDLSSGVNAKLSQAGQPGPQGPQGPQGPAGDSHITYVQNFGGVVNPASGDESGLTMTGEGVQFGPFANGGGCDTPGTDYARMVFHGLDGQALSSVSQLDYTGVTQSSDNTSGVASLTMRVTTDHAGTNGYPNNKFVFSPNTQPGADTNADTRGVVKTYVTTIGTWRLNDDAGDGSNGGEKPWSYWVTHNGTEHITKIDILLGCQAGQDLTGVVRSVQADGTNYTFGKIG